MPARTWYDGEPVDLDERGWTRLVPTFLGMGFRLAVPDPAALARAEDGARAVAALAGADPDARPWEHLRTAWAGPVDVLGGWERHLVNGLGRPWTRVVPAGPGSPASGPQVLEERVSPWPWPAGSPTAGLPMISRLEAATVHEDGVLLLRTDAAGVLRTSSAGTPYLLLDGRWVRPVGGPWTGWAVEREDARTGAEAVGIGPDELDAATVLFAVGGHGEVSVSRRRPPPRRTPQE
ncbi:hypothetical protein [Nocardioides sp. zg-DK7169]|uniref:hypothetical protein n=1 Tax=Nocardioides sp. zg-DK7169 TaxID=2736600 RepID=UPI001555F703|nr:hypothetical protein [Nocardioides sp. zg-DK7169]NPC95415.1 hypothetical protein [Nocardioides sp. zg-DK7169]